MGEEADPVLRLVYSSLGLSEPVNEFFFYFITLSIKTIVNII